jgi:transposase
MLDLYHATRDDLVRIILDQQEALSERERQLARQEHEIGELRAAVAMLTDRIGTLTATPDADDRRSGPAPPAGMPGHKPGRTPTRTAGPRKRRATGAGRRRMQVTARVVHVLPTCPDCGAPLAGGSVKRTREVIDLPPPRITVTAHVYVERRCPECGKRCVPPPDLDTVVTGQGRIGHGLTSLLAVCREEARLPIRTIQALLATLTGLHLSVGAIVAASQRLAVRADPVMAAITDAIRASPVVHLDETGWREDGRNGYVWTASTPDARLFRHGTRQKAMVDALLGDAYAGVVVSDFYAAYTGDERMHQYCWAHLLREIHDLTDRHPEDPVLAGWADGIGVLVARAQAGAVGAPRARWAVRRAVQADLRQLCLPWQQVQVPQRKLCARILTHLASLFTFVTEPDVPPTNNAAERSLRHLVVARKISGGTRSTVGTATRMTLASLFGTWRALDRNPFTACHDLLASPQV